MPTSPSTGSVLREVLATVLVLIAAMALMLPRWAGPRDGVQETSRDLQQLVHAEDSLLRGHGLDSAVALAPNQLLLEGPIPSPPGRPLYGGTVLTLTAVLHTPENRAGSMAVIRDSHDRPHRVHIGERIADRWVLDIRERLVILSVPGRIDAQDTLRLSRS